MRLLLRGNDVEAEGQHDLRTDPKPDVIRFEVVMLIHGRWPAQMDLDFRAGDSERFPGADVKGNSAPAPGINVQFERSESFYVGILADTRLLPIAAKLAAHQVLWLERRDGLEHLHLFITDRFAVGADGRFHC